MNLGPMWVTPHPSQERKASIPSPTPEDAGLNINEQYLVIDLFPGNTPTDEALVGVLNSKGELWYISNRYLLFRRVVTDVMTYTYPETDEDNYGLWEDDEI